MKQIRFILKIRKFNAKFDNSFVWQVEEMSEYLNSMQARLNNI
jgi:hypothetical protein